jgi:hypothetical protein
MGGVRARLRALMACFRLSQVGGQTISLTVPVRVVNGQTVVELTFRTNNLDPHALGDGN